jgi:hypothetical protein
MQYTTEQKARAGISAVRVKKVTSTLVSWRRYLKVPYQDINIKDLDTAILALKNGTNTKNQSYSDNAKHDYIRILRQFVHYLFLKITKKTKKSQDWQSWLFSVLPHHPGLVVHQLLKEGDGTVGGSLLGKFNTLHEE